MKQRCSHLINHHSNRLKLILINKIIRKLPKRVFSKLNYPLIINSYGRSGSTVLKNSIVERAINTRIKGIKRDVYSYISQEAWDLDGAALKDGLVYKTHDYPPKRILNENIRMIYTFADPADVVLSLLRLHKVKGEEWMKLHYSHLKATYGNFHNIIKEDQLQLKRHLNTWKKEERFPILFIKYERMWDYQDELSSFLELPVRLPEFKVRKSKSKISEINSSQEDTLNETYQELKDQVCALEDMFIKNNSSYSPNNL